MIREQDNKEREESLERMRAIDVRCLQGVGARRRSWIAPRRMRGIDVTVVTSVSKYILKWVIYINTIPSITR